MHACTSVCRCVCVNMLRFLYSLVTCICSLSMLPLFVKDGLFVAYLASIILFYVLADVLMGDEVQSAIKSNNTKDGQRKTQTNEFAIFSGPRFLSVVSCGQDFKFKFILQ